MTQDHPDINGIPNFLQSSSTDLGGALGHDMLDHLNEKLRALRNNTKRRHLDGRAESASNPPRIRLYYNDEGIRSILRQCSPTLDSRARRPARQLQRCPDRCQGTALPQGRLDNIDPRGPMFDVSTFFGIEWCKSGL
ncbi:hypothetical protein PHYSODRAFT_305403 [Phytophthora sojae]|uniref:Uncharacterized protein n=1 Tax=Phytophthora sojae (strain P6497) TaxID=1094619 RepID=G5A3A0_PHYSP|nr:hypothetical protein PHYSODRAFT_305403 [Phytophthora sojae]EGZ10140.1 hypothetical protein PHYSODRAFT_305403 [Phytophthora sojae]|eukprot:XP_009535001.1 hypothetical protein PHYSODRAFT_305403 [Phytophthora sojae]